MSWRLVVRTVTAASWRCASAAGSSSSSLLRRYCRTVAFLRSVRRVKKRKGLGLAPRTYAARVSSPRSPCQEIQRAQRPLNGYERTTGNDCGSCRALGVQGRRRGAVRAAGGLLDAATVATRRSAGARIRGEGVLRDRTRSGHPTAATWLVSGQSIRIVLAQPAQARTTPVVIYLPGLGESSEAGALGARHGPRRAMAWCRFNCSTRTPAPGGRTSREAASSRRWDNSDSLAPR